MSQQKTTIFFFHEDNKWELEVSYWPGYPATWSQPSEPIEFEVDKAFNLETKEEMDGPKFMNLIGEDGLCTIEAMLSEAGQDAFEDYCDRQYDEWKDRQWNS